MKIAIIGVGNVGGALAEAATKAGHQVTLAAAHPENAQKIAADTGAQAAPTPRDAAQGAEIVVLAVPATVAPSVVKELGDAAAGAVVIDSTNPMNDTYSDLTTQGTSVAEQIAEAAPGTRVVKAFNTIFASRHASPSEGGQPLDAFLAGDDEGAKQATSELASSLGYRPIDAGGLRMARTLEEMALLNITLNARNGWAWQSAYRLVGPTG
jgi:8-hydroxy-5-deazaflavin:NADPH oxidoreductase